MSAGARSRPAWPPWHPIAAARCALISRGSRSTRSCSCTPGRISARATWWPGAWPICAARCRKEAFMGDDDALRADYRAHAVPNDPHPDDLTWERLATDELRQEERLQLADHVTRCA